MIKLVITQGGTRMKYKDSKCRKVGNASGFIIDKDALEKADIKLDDEVTVEATKSGIILKKKE